MCGIVGYVGEQQAAPVLLEGLSKLEYRGYDSAGLAVRNDSGDVRIVKVKGRLKGLYEKTNDGHAVSGCCGIGHTRWATHGEPSEINAHPHVSGNIYANGVTKDQSDIVGVHNGIIENYQELRDKLIRKGYSFYSQTDTEVLVKLVDYYYKKYNIGPIDAIAKTMVRVRGSYALAVMFKDYPGEIWAARKDSPMIIGLGDNETFLASDVPAILKHTRKVYYIGNLEMAKLTPDGVHFYNLDGDEVKKDLVEITWDSEAAEKGGYEHFMMKEIHEQPKAVRDTINTCLTIKGADSAANAPEAAGNAGTAGSGRIPGTAGSADTADTIGSAVNTPTGNVPTGNVPAAAGDAAFGASDASDASAGEQGVLSANVPTGYAFSEKYYLDLEKIGLTDDVIKGVSQIYIVACGSASYVGHASQYIFEDLTRIPVRVDLASEFRYRKPILSEGTLVVIISQSGETADSLAALRESKERGVKTLAIVNVMGSSIAREADFVFYTMAGPEIAVATTKAYSCQLVACYMLALKFAAVRGTIDAAKFDGMIDEMLKLPEKMESVISDSERIQWVASKLSNIRDIYYIGRGLDYAVCMEGCLKLKEISYIHSEAYAAGELKHGTISLIEDGTIVAGILTQHDLIEKTVSNMLEVKSRGAYLMGFTTYGHFDVEDVADFTFYIPGTDEHFAASLAVIPLQLLGYYVAVSKGLDVDKPRNLAKSVTVE